MLKKIWNQFSFAIILILVTCTFALISSNTSKAHDEQKYIKVTVSEGDSLWEISQQYSSQHKLSNNEFVSWVKKHNAIEDSIYPGEQITIPVTKSQEVTTEFASAPLENNE